jgi:UDP-N-acetylglucosamine acyltransferase
VLTVGNRARSHGINVIGLKRRGVPEATNSALRRADSTQFRAKRGRPEAQERGQEREAVAEVAELLDFIRTSQRGVVA